MLSDTSAHTYTFNAVAGTAYIVTTVTTSGADTLLAAYKGIPHTGIPLTSIDGSFNDPLIAQKNTLSFIADFTGSATIAILNMSESINVSYTLQVVTSELTIGETKSGFAYDNILNTNPIYYSFEAQAGSAYQVRLTPQSGNVNIGSVHILNGASLGSSSQSGLTTDTVSFAAPTAQRYYVAVNPTNVATEYDIQVVPVTGGPDLSVVINSAVSDGTNVTVNYTVSNIGLTASGAFNVAGWANANAPPVVGNTGQALNVAHGSLAAGTSATGSFVIANAANAGTAYIIADNTSLLAELSETNNVSSGMAWAKPLSVPLNFNFEDGLFPAAMSTSGNAAWSNVSGQSSGSARSLEAGSITDSQSSCVSMIVSNPSAANMRFDRSVSSEAGYDFLRFYVDNAERASWSGAVPWGSSSFIPVSAGLHVFKWCYIKDHIVSGGFDTAWIDNIIIAPLPDPVPSPQSFNFEDTLFPASMVSSGDAAWGNV